MKSSRLLVFVLLPLVFGCEPDTGLIDTEDIDPGETPNIFALEQPFPNPFDSQTTITFRLPRTTFVTLTVENPIRDVVRTLALEEFPAGMFAVTWDAKNDVGETVDNGFYFINLLTDSFRQTQIAKLER